MIFGHSQALDLNHTKRSPMQPVEPLAACLTIAHGEESPYENGNTKAFHRLGYLVT